MKRQRFSYRCAGHLTDVVVGRDLSSMIANSLSKLRPYSLFLVSDAKTAPFAKAIAAEIPQGIEYRHFALPRGEKAKSIHHAERLSEAILATSPTRDSLVVAIGGGALGDVTGFVASMIMRGIRWVHCPTTLLAMVDASVGGKTAINSPRGKNLIGAFHQPEAVIADLDHLRTLPKKESKAAMAEVIKVAATCSAPLFRMLEEAEDWQADDFLGKAVTSALRLKAKIVEADEKESAKRRVLNYGHTIGHAVEEFSAHKIRHGEAVAIGMAIETQIGVALKHTPEVTWRRIEKLLVKAGLERSLPQGIKLKRMVSLLEVDKKRQKSGLPFPLPVRVGAYRELSLTPREAAEMALRC